MKPSIKVLIIKPELPKEVLEKFGDVRKWFEDKIHIDISFHKKEYDCYGWSMEYPSPGNRITRKWKSDNLIFDADISIVFIPEKKWLMKGRGGLAPNGETKEMIILKDTSSIEWQVYAVIHELLHTFAQMSGSEDILHEHDTGSKGVKGLDDMLPVLESIDWGRIK
tara:strand:- start:22 stop:519 length:498 start_codon:yes stop_codon:yes gene_type:complete